MLECRCEGQDAFEIQCRAGLLGLKAALHWVIQKKLMYPTLYCEHPRAIGFLEGDLVVPKHLRGELQAIHALWCWSKAVLVPVQQVRRESSDWVVLVWRSQPQCVVARFGIATGGRGYSKLADGLEWRTDEDGGQAEEKQKGARDGAV